MHISEVRSVRPDQKSFRLVRACERARRSCVRLREAPLLREVGGESSESPAVASVVAPACLLCVPFRGAAGGSLLFHVHS